jgi:hypothetical protein
MNITVTGCVGRDWIQMSMNEIQWRAIINMIMSLQLIKMEGVFIIFETSGFREGLCCMELDS